jgi:hypothetical protein
LCELELERARSLRDGRRLQALSASAAPVRARDDERRPVGAAGGEPLEHRGGEVGRSEEDGAQRGVAVELRRRLV